MRHKVKSVLDADFVNAHYVFISMFTAEKECFLSNIIDAESRLTEIGAIVERVISDITVHDDRIEIYKYGIMPNHVDIIFKVSMQIADRVNMIDHIRSNQSPAYFHVSRASSKIAKEIKIRCQNKGLYGVDWDREIVTQEIKNSNTLLMMHHEISEQPKKWCRDKHNPENFLWSYKR